MLKYSSQLRCLTVIVLLCSFCNVRAQDYSIVPVNLNAQGVPNILFLANARVVNNSSSTIYLFMERTVKNIPANWSSCFCHPFCVAPFIDTISFSIPPNSQDSIKPNFFADSIPGIGTIQVRLYQIGFESQADTINFTGSTLSWASVNDQFNDANVSVYPNPCQNSVSLLLPELNGTYSIDLYNAGGKAVYREENLKTREIIIPLKGQSAGIYSVVISFENGIAVSRKILKAQ